MPSAEDRPPPVFVDSNVLVYSRDESEPEKQPRARAWLEALWESRRGRVSAQVLEEFYVTVTQKLDPGLPAQEARSDVRALGAWHPVAIDHSLLPAAWDVEDRYGFSFWDSLILAAARRLDCGYLLTEDLQHGQEVEGLTVLSPFRAHPSKILHEGTDDTGGGPGYRQSTS